MNKFVYRNPDADVEDVGFASKPNNLFLEVELLPASRARGHVRV